MFKKLKYRLKFTKTIMPFAVGVKRFFVLNVLVSVINLALNFIKPLFYRMFIDEVILQGKINAFIYVLSGYLSVCFIDILFGYIKKYGENRLINRIVFRIRYKMWKALFKQDFTEYEKQNIGGVKMKIEDDTNSISPFANRQTTDYVIACITVLVSIFLLFSIEWRLALFSIVVIPLSLFFDNAASKKEKYYNNKQRINDQNMTAWLHTSIQGWREVKALNLQRHEKRAFVHFLNERGKLFAKAVQFWTVRVLVLPKIRDDLFMQFGLYFFGGLLIINNHLKIGDLLVFSMYYAMLSGAVKTVSSTDAELQSSMPYTNRLIDELEKADIRAQDGIIPGNSNEIVFDNVSFAYNGGDKKVIDEFSMKISKGERIAITGKSGCGKTTVLKLLTGMITPDEGQVLFSGVDLKDIDLHAMHGRMGYVMQENLLFNMTIRENLMYGKSGASESDMTKACKKAYIYDFIEGLPDGLETVIGERGIKLSGGQRQRIVLARLFLRDVDIFIFDEATNALDQYSENIVHDAIKNIARDKTIIVVAHRESSIELCDRKIAM